MSLKAVSTLDGWLRASEADHLAAGREIERLHPGFAFTGVDETTVGARTAGFEFEGAHFVFTPGGTLELGFAEAALVVSSADVRTLCESGEFSDEDEVREALSELRETLPDRCSPRRKVSVPSLLVEADTIEVVEGRLDASHPRFRELAAGLESGAVRVVELDGLRYRATRRDGHVEVSEQALVSTLVKDFNAQGLRLLTEDEWEWCAGGGVSTLFRWGDRIPVDEEPTGQDSGFEKPELLEPNRFGLMIGQNPYHWEACDGWLKGGDGGDSWCGGEGTLRIWASLMIPLRSPITRGVVPAVRRCVQVGA